jgi:hypothetical protein
MQDKPDKQMLLQAISEFLLTEVKPAITESRLSFRVLIAANLAQVVAKELVEGDGQEARELERLRVLLSDVAGEPAVDRPAIQRQVLQLNGELARRLRAGSLAGAQLDETRRHLLTTLREKLSVNNPFFDTRPDVD